METVAKKYILSCLANRIVFTWLGNITGVHVTSENVLGKFFWLGSLISPHQQQQQEVAVVVVVEKKGMKAVVYSSSLLLIIFMSLPDLEYTVTSSFTFA